ncbi:MAG: hypothetical protein ACLGIV_00325 [Actinomycetes bacterium]
MTSPSAALPVSDDPLADLTLAELRAHRHALLAEAASTTRWRRLVQARLDLVVAEAAPADDLTRPCGDLPEPPDTGRLAELLSAPTDDAVGLLRRLDHAQRALSGYGASVQAAASAATRELVERYAAAPGGCLDASSR